MSGKIRKKTLLVDARTMGSKPSGIGMYTYSFLKEIVKRQELKVILLSDVAVSQEIERISESGIEVITYGSRIYQSADILKYFAFVKKKLIQIQPDVFWEPNSLIPSKLKGYKGKVIITIHDLFPLTMSDCFSLQYRLYFKYVLRKSIETADMLFFISEETRKSVQKNFLEAKGKEYYVSYIIIDEKMDTVQSKDGGYFLYVGNMERRKGVDVLLGGYQEYCNRGGDKELHLIGKMREKDIEKQLMELKKTNLKIHYLGYISEEEKKKEYRECGCFVFPSKAEGFGMPVIEAMQYYKPIIVSELSIFKEIVGEQTVNYFKIDTEERVENLANAMLEYKRSNIENYNAIIHRYTADILGDKLIEKILSV